MKYYSKHSFMFPFQWDSIKSSNKGSYNDRTDLKDFERLFMNCGSHFKKVKFSIEGNAGKFNEYNYFHEFVRKALYHTSDTDFLSYYEIDEPNGEYNIEVEEGEKKSIFQLTLDSVCLHVYDTGVGVISFNLTNNKYSDEISILKINEFGRRLYPQFMIEKDPLVCKKVFLPNRIWGQIGGFQFDEDFTAYNSPIQGNSTFIPPDHILKIFGYQGETRLGDRGQSFVFNKIDEVKNTIRIKQVTDDRMFFLCWYGNNRLADSFKEDLIKDEINSSHNYWYAFLFGDKNLNSLSVQCNKLQKEEIEKYTYKRWANFGTFFGVTRDSFVCISSDEDTLGKNSAPPIFHHMQTMYYQMAILCLVQRATILRFSWEMSQITNKLFSSVKTPKVAITDLYENYLRFINQIYFREVTSQIQGIELYTMFQRAMNLEKEAKDLDGEMQELFNYLSVKEQTKLSRVADLFLPITLLAGVLGINTIEFEGNYWKWWSMTVTIILVIWSVYALISYFYNKFKNK